MTDTTLVQKRGRGRPRKEVQTTEQAILNMFLAGMDKHVVERIDGIADDKINELFGELMPLIEEARKTKRIEVITPETRKIIGGRVHFAFEKLLKIAGARLTPLLVGPAGTGKSTAAEQVANALDLPDYAMSVQAQTSKSDIMGFINANGLYVRTMFREAYENGGVFLMDEIDAGNSNVLIAVNNALSGSKCAFPDGMVEKHKDFIFIGTANTYGTGANRVYVGRNQLDAATLDRFVVIDWPVDEVLEGSIVAHKERGPQWHKVVKAVRKMVDDAGFRVVISPRATIKGAELFELGLTFDEVAATILCSAATEDQKQRILSTARLNWRP